MRFKIAFALWIAVVGVLAWQKAHAEEQRQVVPQIELVCDKIGAATFYEDGTFEVDGRVVEYVDNFGPALYFTGGVKLVGELDDDAVYFDRSTLTIKGRSFPCTAQ